MPIVQLFQGHDWAILLGSSGLLKNTFFLHDKEIIFNALFNFEIVKKSREKSLPVWIMSVIAKTAQGSHSIQVRNCRIRHLSTHFDMPHKSICSSFGFVCCTCTSTLVSYGCQNVALGTLKKVQFCKENGLEFFWSCLQCIGRDGNDALFGSKSFYHRHPKYQKQSFETLQRLDAWGFSNTV